MKFLPVFFQKNKSNRFVFFINVHCYHDYYCSFVDCQHSTLFLRQNKNNAKFIEKWTNIDFPEKKTVFSTTHIHTIFHSLSFFCESDGDNRINLFYHLFSKHTIKLMMSKIYLNFTLFSLSI